MKESQRTSEYMKVFNHHPVAAALYKKVGNRRVNLKINHINFSIVKKMIFMILSTFIAKKVIF